jgi:hypothetical protein
MFGEEKMVRAIALAGVVVATSLVSVLGSGFARADDLDELYFRELRNFGFVITDYTLARTQALQTCDMLDRGRTMGQTIGSLKRAGNYTHEKTLAIIAASITVYCPRHYSTR